ncbi:hypothetical protein CLAFUW4_12547 [Fulvia fulva]|uniref:Uncharacterized protein n=1 Tax=Passalora fulva TaxID=5499 RepID=A0A9Q8PDP3_PASFU|nr:uncharacterized protein CLAFUR5_11572 [Fulvia fulva]KAK4618336.1 hypothetical protein CLAFUR4_12552 [Fulvia fulva]KAK4618494.1 hypothetical protein CLAFUR0_12563 [Fulvia fulva]UJO20512.1 hypothetical protein CLAFUR5_11572 [Fulvia fulva]WPV18672.1 hypothetical protein CLAFUW4_12547 [Fulvia fulva]WPV32826.1 hypothetical protein CLAFUW7_12554 [Fulvia fulva]
MGLLDLPPKLRNPIYQLVLVDEDNDHSFHDPDQPPKDPSLLFTNRQIRSEASGIFWNSNTYCFEDSTKTVLWLQRQPAHKVAALGSVLSSNPIRARIWSWEFVQAKQNLLDLFTSLWRKGSRKDVVKLPMLLKEEGKDEKDLIWVSLADIDGYKKVPGGCVVCKAIEEEH